VAVAEFSYEVCTLGTLATSGAAEYEHNLGIAFEFNFIHWDILFGNFPDGLNVLSAIDFYYFFLLLVELYNWF